MDDRPTRSIWPRRWRAWAWAAPGGMCDSFRWNIEYQVHDRQPVGGPPGRHLVPPSPTCRRTIWPLAAVLPSPDDGFETTYTVNIKRGAASPIVEGHPSISRCAPSSTYLHLDPCVNVLATTLVTTTGPHSSNGRWPCRSSTPSSGARARVLAASLGHVDRIYDEAPRAQGDRAPRPAVGGPQGRVPGRGRQGTPC